MGVADKSRVIVQQIMDINDLCKACLEGDKEQVEDIIAKGEVDVNHNNVNGRPPLICAVMKEHPKIVKMLLDCKILSTYPGIKMYVKDNAGNSLITIAESQCGRRFADESKIQRHKDILSFLREKPLLKNKTN